MAGTAATRGFITDCVFIGTAVAPGVDNVGGGGGGLLYTRDNNMVWFPTGNDPSLLGNY